MSDDKLAREIAYYEANKEDYLRSLRGRYVVIHEERLRGDFPTFNDAYEFALREFGDVTLLIQLVEAEEPAPSSPAMTLGILRAHIS